MNCISIGLEGCTTQVHQLHESNNSYIKPFIDMSDLNASVYHGSRKEILVGDVLVYINIA